MRRRVLAVLLCAIAACPAAADAHFQDPFSGRPVQLVTRQTDPYGTVSLLVAQPARFTPNHIHFGEGPATCYGLVQSSSAFLGCGEPGIEPIDLVSTVDCGNPVVSSFEGAVDPSIARVRLDLKEKRRVSADVVQQSSRRVRTRFRLMEQGLVGLPRAVTLRFAHRLGYFVTLVPGEQAALRVTGFDFGGTPIATLGQDLLGVEDDSLDCASEGGTFQPGPEEPKRRRFFFRRR